MLRMVILRERRVLTRSWSLVTQTEQLVSFVVQLVSNLTPGHDTHPQPFNRHEAHGVQSGAAGGVHHHHTL